MLIHCVCSVYGRLIVSFFFFKQKTAYEMRISDWSSDVCSSDPTCALLALLRPGDHILASQWIYGGTHRLLTQEFKTFGIDATLVNPKIGRASCRERVCRYV